MSVQQAAELLQEASDLLASSQEGAAADPDDSDSSTDSEDRISSPTFRPRKMPKISAPKSPPGGSKTPPGFRRSYIKVLKKKKPAATPANKGKGRGKGAGKGAK